MVTTFLEEAFRGDAPPLVPITVNLYHQMLDNGLLRDGDPIELIDGLLVRKDRSARGEDVMGHNPRHAMLVVRIMRLLMSWSESCGCHVRVQLPITLSGINEPEPDIALIQGSDSDFSERHPGPGDVPLVIEVADSSVNTDRSTKQRLYASAGIPRYWLVNIPAGQVEVLEQPDIAAGRYLRSSILAAGQTIRLEIAPQQPLEIDVAKLFS